MAKNEAWLCLMPKNPPSNSSLLCINQRLPHGAVFFKHILCPFMGSEWAGSREAPPLCRRLAAALRHLPRFPPRPPTSRPPRRTIGRLGSSPSALRPMPRSSHSPNLLRLFLAVPRPRPPPVSPCPFSFCRPVCGCVVEERGRRQWETFAAGRAAADATTPLLSG